MTLELRNTSNLKSAALRLGSSLGLVLSLCACGTSYSVKKANHENLSKGTAEAGLYYYLPKTKVTVEAIATGTKPEYGLYSKSEDKLLGQAISNPDDNNKPFKTYAELFEYNKAKCDSNGYVLVPKPSTLIDKTAMHKYALSDFSISTNAIADQSHLYRLDIDPSALSSFSHKIAVNDQGILTTATTTVTEAVQPFIYNSVKSLAEFAAVGLGSQALDSGEYCEGLKEAENIVKTQDEELDKLKQERMRVVDNAQPHVDGKALDIKLKLMDEKISNFKKSVADAEAKFKKKTHKVTYVLVGDIDPNSSESKTYTAKDWAVYKPKYEPKADDKTPKRISFLPGTASKLLDRVQKPEDTLTALYQGLMINFDFTVSGTEDITLPNNQEAGYRYRIPRKSGLRIVHTQDGTMTTLASTDIHIAQFGPIAALPARFFGSKGTLDLAFNPKTGGLQSATIAGDPFSGTAASQYVDVLKDYKTAETAADEAQATKDKAKAVSDAAAAASDARADIDATLIEIERLEALKKLRDLRIELGLPAE